jgi:hypothetical protein
VVTVVTVVRVVTSQSHCHHCYFLLSQLSQWWSGDSGDSDDSGNSGMHKNCWTFLTVRSLHSRNSTLTPKSVSFSSECTELVKKSAAFSLNTSQSAIVSRFARTWHHPCHCRSAILISLHGHVSYPQYSTFSSTQRCLITVISFTPTNISTYAHFSMHQQFNSSIHALQQQCT